MVTWTEELKASVVSEYQDSDPNPDNTIELCKALADKHESSSNGVRKILVDAGVYVPQAKAATKAVDPDKPKRVSKADAIAELESIIQALGKDVDAKIVGQLTGKAAMYFTSLLKTEQE